MSIIFILGLFFIFFVGRDALIDQNLFQFYADSITYHNIYNGDAFIAGGSLIGVADNYAGPMLVLELVNGNVYGVVFINIAIYAVSISIIAKRLHLNINALNIILLVSPITISSLLSVNKEIFIFPFLAFAISAHQNRSIILTIASIVVAALFRWQLIIFYFIILFIIYAPKILNSRYLVVLLLLTLVSAGYLLALNLLETVISASEASIAIYEGGSGLFEATLKLQKEGWYILIFPIRALHMFFGMAFRFSEMLAPVDFYNDIIIPIHCFISLVIFVSTYSRRMASIDRDFNYMAIIFLIIFCISPIFSPRYLYPAYVFMALNYISAHKIYSRK